MREQEILRRLCCFAGFLPHLSWALVAKRKWAFINSLLLIHDFRIHICSIILIFYTSLSSSFPKHTISILHTSTQCKRQHVSFDYASMGVGLSFCKLGRKSVHSGENTVQDLKSSSNMFSYQSTQRSFNFKKSLWLGP